MMGKIFITSDLHFGHDKEFLYHPRGFNNIRDHDKAIIKRWNDTIQMEDDIYVLGDLMLNDNEYGLSCLKQLKGKIHVVRGNHDSEVRMNLYDKCCNIIEITEGQFLRYDKYHFYLSHYPCLCGNLDDSKPLNHRIISLCGHTHTKDPFVDWDKGLIFHVEMDTNNCTPWLLDDVIAKIKKAI